MLNRIIKINPRNTIYFLGIISLVSLIFAFFMQHFFELIPCDLCILQRYPHYGILIVTILCLLKFSPKFCIYSILILSIISIFFSLYHTLVELDLIENFKGCSSNVVNNFNEIISVEKLLSIKPIRCDFVSWSFLGLSMTNWNLVLSIILSIISMLTIRNFKRY